MQTAASSANYVIYGAVIGALLTGILNIIRDWWNRRRDREDERNRLMGKLKGQKHLTLQYYAFYFFSFIDHEYLSTRSIIQGVHGIDYKQLLSDSIPADQRNKEIMKMADKARFESVEYKSYLNNRAKLNEYKLDLTKNIKDLLIIIGSLQNYYPKGPDFNDLSHQIEVAMDYYASLEKFIKDKFNPISQDALKKAGLIPKEVIDKGIPINHLQDDYFYDWIKKVDGFQEDVRKEREARSKNLEDKIDDLINHIYNKY